MNGSIQALLVTDLKASIAANETTFAAKSHVDPSFHDLIALVKLNFASRRVGASTFSTAIPVDSPRKARPLDG